MIHTENNNFSSFSFLGIIFGDEEKKKNTQYCFSSSYCFFDKFYSREKEEKQRYYDFSFCQMVKIIKKIIFLFFKIENSCTRKSIIEK